MESSQCENLDHLFCRKVWSAGLHCQFIYIKWNKCFCSYFLLLNLKVCYEIFWHLNRRWCKYSFFILDNQTLRSIHTWTSISVYQYIYIVCAEQNMFPTLVPPTVRSMNQMWKKKYLKNFSIVSNPVSSVKFVFLFFRRVTVLSRVDIYLFT